jgi:hypothetical protein
MKRTLSLLTLFGLLLAVSCFEPPQFSEIPLIEFENVRTRVTPDPQVADSLIITVSFRDGDGDLGRDGQSENDPPFNQKWYYLLNPIASCEETVTPPCKKVSFIDEGNLANYVKYSMRRTNPNYDTLPAYVKPYFCENYQVLKENGNGPTIDTIYFQYNPREYTFFCDLYFIEAGVAKRFDWYIGGECPAPWGSGFNGFFNILAAGGDPDLGLPLEGTITYKVASTSIATALPNKVLQLRIRIMDRAGNYSNEVTSNNFTLD